MYLLRRAAANLKKYFQSPSRVVASLNPPCSLSGKSKFLRSYHSRSSNWSTIDCDAHFWSIITAQAAIVLGMNVNIVLADSSPETSAENVVEEASASGFQRIEDGSVTSNEHTIKWRIFTDNGREYFLKGKLDAAEKFFISAIDEAKEGFGERDAHVASACNNLAELYRVKKEFEKAEPLYLEAINILEESFSPDDIRVGAALHNLGLFYLLRQKTEEARRCYERALKIKGRVLGHNHTDYADTMYRLGTVLYFQGKEKDAEALIQDSIEILEAAGEGESMICMRRLRYLAQILVRSNRLEEAENVQRKILHIMEISKGWDSIETILAAEGLALTLQSAGKLGEAQELYERCLDARKVLVPAGHIQIGTNMLQIARAIILQSDRLRKMNISEASSELEKVKDYLDKSVRIAGQVLRKWRMQKGDKQMDGVSVESGKEGRAALVVLLQSLETLSRLENARQALKESGVVHPPSVGAEKELFRCLSAFKEFEDHRSISDAPEVKSEYLSCLKRLSSLISDKNVEESGRIRIQELNDKIKHVEAEINEYSRSHKLKATGSS